MAAYTTDEPLISVTLPLARNADPGLLRICLSALAAQTFGDFEILVLASSGSPEELRAVLRDFPMARVHEGDFSKASARNFLAAKAAGRYILYIDVDMELSPKVVEECVALATTTGSQAVVIPQREAPSEAFWAKCRALEWELLSEDIAAWNPYFLEAQTFRAVGGFDSDLDLLDDWALTLKLKTQGIPSVRIQSPMFITDSTRLLEIFRRKLERGRYIPGLLAKFRDVPQVRLSERFRTSYVRNWRLLLRSPLTSLGLCFLKCIEGLGLLVGRLSAPANKRWDGAAAYRRPDVAESYDSLRLKGNFNRYKHYAETRALAEINPSWAASIMEVGCGTGRITAELVRWNARVVPVDPSRAMLRQFTAKRGLPPPVQADGTALPFRQGAFEGVISVRVFWHLPSSGHAEAMLDEITRVMTGYAVLDIANQARWQHPLLKTLGHVYFFLRPSERAIHNSTLLYSIERLRLAATQRELRLEKALPLDVLTPFWLDALPASVARLLFPVVYPLERAISRYLPPARLLVLLSAR